METSECIVCVQVVLIISGPTSWVMFRWLPEGTKRSPEAAQLSPSASCRKPSGDLVLSLFTSSQGSPLSAHWLQMSYKYASSLKVGPIQRRLDKKCKPAHCWLTVLIWISPNFVLPVCSSSCSFRSIHIVVRWSWWSIQHGPQAHSEHVTYHQHRGV